ncbi:transporter substrate-binding domain-containing protein [Burkholderiaceae bacterium DAT-1]|nr:transporter substrate-binding domain-containing protein [Burkholderiaceae bacterium DAT-1]
MVEIKDGQKPEGTGVDVIDKISQQSGIPIQIEVVPLARAFANIESQPRGCGIGTTRTPTNEPQFKWAGPIVRQTARLYARPDSSIQLTSLDQAKPYTIGVLRGSVLSRQLAERGLKIEEGNDSASSMKKLLAGRIDLWAENSLAAQFNLEAAGNPALKTALIIAPIDGFIACNRAVGDKDISRLDATVRNLRNNGALHGFGF